MTDWVRFELDDPDGSVLVEIEPEEGLERLARGRDNFTQARETFEHAMTDVRDAASAALRKFKEMPTPPDEVEIEFGVKLSASAGAVIAKTGVEGQLVIKIKWHREHNREKNG